MEVDFSVAAFAGAFGEAPARAGLTRRGLKLFMEAQASISVPSTDKL
jgi:hypothetical protein